MLKIQPIPEYGTFRWINLCKQKTLDLVSSYLGVWVPGFLGVWVSGCLGIWVSGCLGIWVSGYLGGYIAIIEITWITNSRPKEVEDFWLSAYPEIDLASNKISFIESNGFSLAGYFYLGQNSWIENYYKPLESSYEVFLGRNNDSEIARRVVEEHHYEYNLYLKYLDYYSYGFYVARKTD